MNRQNLMRLKDIVARNRCHDGAEIPALLEASPERAEFLERRKRTHPDLPERSGFEGVCDFLGIEVSPPTEGDSGWLHALMYGNSDAPGTSGNPPWVDAVLYGNALNRPSLVEVIDLKIQSLPWH